MVAALCALDGKTINIENVYKADGFNFDGTKSFDKKTGFHSKSMLVVPMKNHEGEVIGVCQLINHQDPQTGEVTSFSKQDEKSVLSLASQAAVSITNVTLINDLRQLLEAFIRTIAHAIDAKSPYTGGHVQKVAQLSMLIAEAINETDNGVYKDIHYTPDQLNEIRIAGLMHDVGKITTPEYIVDKSTKLETIYDRIETISTRFELLKRELELENKDQVFQLLQEGSQPEEINKLKMELQNKLNNLDSDLDFLKEANIGGEFMGDDKLERIKQIARYTITIRGNDIPLLNENEVENLSIRKGTLTNSERLIINSHAKISNEMLEVLPFPKKLSRVPEIAGGHHEKLNGKGYPNGLTANELSLEARILALADIFEALTSSDRPYKEGKRLSEAMKIIDYMVKDYELDPNLVQFFYDKELHLKYAVKNLLSKQLDM